MEPVRESINPLHVLPWQERYSMDALLTHIEIVSVSSTVEEIQQNFHHKPKFEGRWVERHATDAHRLCFDCLTNRAKEHISSALHE